MFRLYSVSAAALAGAVVLCVSASANAANLLSPNSASASVDLTTTTAKAVDKGASPGWFGTPKELDAIPVADNTKAGDKVANIQNSASLIAKWGGLDGTDINSGAISYAASRSITPLTDPLAAKVGTEVDATWDYDTFVNKPIVFSISYNFFDIQGQTDGLGMWDFRIVDANSGKTLTTFGTINGFDDDEPISGLFTVDLQPGFYDIIVENHDVTKNVTGPLSGGYSGDFNWCVDRTGACAAAVPEPTAWALMILGFGVSGLALRRRRVAALTA